MRWFIHFLLFVALSAGGCAKQVTVVEIPTLQVDFADPEWTGDMIPPGQQCRKCGGDGSTPRFIVSNIPEGASDLVIQFRDGAFDSGMTSQGAHGAIRVKIADHSRMTTPAVAGETLDMPQDVTIEKRHIGGNAGQTGAYLPPCACLAKNRSYHKYYALIQAVDANGTVLAERTIMIGKFKN